MLTYHIDMRAMCHHWEELPVEQLEAAAEREAEDADDVEQEVAPA